MDPHIKYMRLALREAKRGFGGVSPNPRVGALAVADGRILSRGYHKAFGEPHAEAVCLAKLPAADAARTTLYVNLEPCCHQGKTPPCANAIIQSGVRRMVYGIGDPNPLVNGQGLQTLRDAGLEVIGPVLPQEAAEINRGYLKYRRTGLPWVTLKWAQSLDGRIATSSGDSRWISSSESLKLAHRLRAEHDAVLIGINTALADNPRLTVREVKGRDPKRIVLDSGLRLTPDAALFHDGQAPTYIATRPYPPGEKAAQLVEIGAEIIWIPQMRPDELDLKALLEELTRRGILYLLVEGGARVLASFVRQKLYDEIVFVTAPILIGGDGVPSLSSLGVAKLADAQAVVVKDRKVVGHDLAVWLRAVP